MPTNSFFQNKSNTDPVLTQEDFFHYTIDIIKRTRRAFFGVFLLTILIGLTPVTLYNGQFSLKGYSPTIYYILAFIIDHSVKQMIYFKDIQIIISSPLSVINICVELALMLAFLINAPYMCYQFYDFLAPALYPSEKKALRESMLMMGILFFIGAFIAYYFAVPITLGVLTSITIPFLDFGTTPLVLFYTLDSVFSLIFWTVIATGFLYTLPMIIYILVLLDVVDPNYLEKKKKNIVVSILTFAAIITPDPTLVSMLLVSTPLILINELIVYRGMKKKKQLYYKRRRQSSYVVS